MQNIGWGSASDYPSTQQRGGDAVQHCHIVQVARKRLFARLVSKDCAASISADGPAEKGPSEQRPLRYPPRPSLGPQFVEAKQHEGHQIDERKQRKDVGPVEEGGQGHDYYFSGVRLC